MDGLEHAIVRAVAVRHLYSDAQLHNMWSYLQRRAYMGASTNVTYCTADSRSILAIKSAWPIHVVRTSPRQREVPEGLDPEFQFVHRLLVVKAGDTSSSVRGTLHGYTLVYQRACLKHTSMKYVHTHTRTAYKTCYVTREYY